MSYIKSLAFDDLPDDVALDERVKVASYRYRYNGQKIIEAKVYNTAPQFSYKLTRVTKRVKTLNEIRADKPHA
jgi:hypothetical protein